ncbi:MAG: ATP-binding cassette domain-containing protein [Lachnospiraceae bacterium]|nr:ATP-binding cassette domain-containing protein [Lachnospiraceae bacterium]
MGTYMEDKFIEVKQLYKTFHTKKQDIEVLKGIDLSVEKGEIYGIVGFSGAGKSTLVRCINRLEEPDSGSVKIGDKEITALGKAQLNEQRRKIGMIFQQFNLFDSMTVAQNIAYPLKLTGTSSKEADARVEEMLALVGLTEKKNAYPGELSGGQKQRVGIARALANRPDVLLSDEATSALDPQTTLSVLDLLKEINKKLGLTIILITHELEVIKYTCHRMAVMEDGKILEKGPVRDIFQNPECATARNFIGVYNKFRSDYWQEDAE